MNKLISKFIVIGLITQMKHVESIIKKELFRVIKIGVTLWTKFPYFLNGDLIGS